MPDRNRNVTASLVVAPPGSSFPARISFGCEVTGGDHVKVTIGDETFEYSIPRSSVWISLVPTPPADAVVDDGVPTPGGA